MRASREGNVELKGVRASREGNVELKGVRASRVKERVL